MSDASFDPSRSEAPINEVDESQSNGSGNWLQRRLRPGTGTPDRSEADLDGPSPVYPELDATVPAPQLHKTASAATHLHGDVDVVANVIEKLIWETRKQDLLEGVEFSRKQLSEEPFVRSTHWDTVWKQIINPDTSRPRQPVIIVVAPRSCGSTTFALRLLAEHTADNTTVVKLDADWNTPSKGRLPLEKAHAYQLDLKHPENDQVSADFLNALSKHAANLRACRSYLALTVAQDLWKDHRLSERDGIQVVRLHEAPDAQHVVEAHLKAHGYDQLVTSLRSFPKATASLRGLTAVAAVRAAHTVVMAWKEHTHAQQSPVHSNSDGESQEGLDERITAALTDWRGELDSRFGEMNGLHAHDNPSLTVEDRCLLLALAVQQSAPMPVVGRSAASLLEAIGHVPAATGTAAGFSPAVHALAGRGMRRRIQDVGARVDMQDTVVFDRPTYGRAVLEYVWDNYHVMREPLLTWLVETAKSTEPEDHAVGALAELTVRHGTVEYLATLGELTSRSRPEVLGAVMESAVRDEHVGRLAWEALYRWAEQDSYAPAVIALCRRVLEDSSAATSLAKRAMVRLRRIAHTSDEPTVVSQVLTAYDDLAQHSAVAQRLASEVHGWQRGKLSARSGALAFLALMTVRRNGKPWLVCEPPQDIDVQRAVQELLASPKTTCQIISRLTDWIRSCSADPSTYTQLRDQLLPALRGHNMFEAGMKLMKELRGISTVQGISVADDFYNHLVDSRLHGVFPLNGGIV
ncbi:hypothetical protein ACWEWX_27075 [Streptomyces asiaticus]